jgi:hypothetical protein
MPAAIADLANAPNDSSTTELVAVAGVFELSQVKYTQLYVCISFFLLGTFNLGGV